MNKFDWDNSFLVDFDLVTGLSKAAQPSERHLSKMKNMFHDTDAAAKLLETDDPVLYRWFELGTPERAGDLAFGVTILHPGEGMIDFPAFAAILDRAAYSGTITLESPVIREGGADAEKLHRTLLYLHTLF